MAGSVNKVILIGNLGADPDIRTMQSGDKVVNLSVATSESWKDKVTGERKDKTEWHRVVIFNKGLINICERYLKKGSKVYIEGQIETRSWEQNGEKKYTTEIVLRPYRGELTMLDSRGAGAGAYDSGGQHFNDGSSSGYDSGNPASAPQAQSQPHSVDIMDDEIPF